MSDFVREVSENWNQIDADASLNRQSAARLIMSFESNPQRLFTLENIVFAMLHKSSLSMNYYKNSPKI